MDVNEGDVLARHAYDATAGGAPKLLINGLRWDAAGWPTY
jgi:arabinan endo-1,5-alpha-L-arabinosidase